MKGRDARASCSYGTSGSTSLISTPLFMLADAACLSPSPSMPKNTMELRCAPFSRASAIRIAHTMRANTGQSRRLMRMPPPVEARIFLSAPIICCSVRLTVDPVSASRRTALSSSAFDTTPSPLVSTTSNISATPRSNSGCENIAEHVAYVMGSDCFSIATSHRGFEYTLSIFWFHCAILVPYYLTRTRMSIPSSAFNIMIYCYGTVIVFVRCLARNIIYDHYVSCDEVRGGINQGLGDIFSSRVSLCTYSCYISERHTGSHSKNRGTFIPRKPTRNPKRRDVVINIRGYTKNGLKKLLFFYRRTFEN